METLVLARLNRLHPDVAEWTREAKELGRHAGCVFVARGDQDVRYFVKRQRLCLRTLFVYRLLATIGCGPEAFFMIAHRDTESDPYDHIVVTRAVPQFRMASDERGAALLSTEDAMCLLLVVCCFGLGDLPANEDNWGLGQAVPRLAVVDFSFAQFQGMNCVVPMLGLRKFMETCRPLIAKESHTDDSNNVQDDDKDNKEEEEEGDKEEEKDDEDGKGDDRGECDAAMGAFLRAYGRWFGSTEAFDAVTEDAMAHVRDWANDDVIQKEWRQAQTLRAMFEEVEAMGRFQHIARKVFEMFASWIESV